MFLGHLSGSFSKFQLDSWHGWYACWDSLDIVVADVILYHISLHRTKLIVPQCCLWPVLWHTTCIRTPSTSHANLDGGSTVIRSCANASWSNGCCHVWDINHTGASLSATLLKQWSMYDCLWMQDRWWRHYHLQISQLLRILLWMHELHEAVIAYLPLHAGLTGLEPLHSNPWLYSSIGQDVWHTGISPTNLSVYFCFIDTFIRNCIKLALLQDCRKNFFHCFTNCVSDMFCICCSPWLSPRRVRSTFSILTCPCRHTMSIRELCDPSLTNMEWITAAISPNVPWFCPTFCTNLMPSITVADLCVLYPSVSGGLVQVCYFFGKPSGLANAHGIGPSGCTKIAVMFNCLLWAMTIILPKSDMSAFKMAAFPLICTSHASFSRLW